MVKICTKHFTHKLEAETFKTFFNPIQKEQQHQLLLLFSLWSLNFFVHFILKFTRCFYFDLMFTEAIISILYNSDIVYLWKQYRSSTNQFYGCTKNKVPSKCIYPPKFSKNNAKNVPTYAWKLEKMRKTWQCNKCCFWFLPQTGNLCKILKHKQKILHYTVAQEVVVLQKWEIICKKNWARCLMGQLI